MSTSDDLDRTPAHRASDPGATLSPEVPASVGDDLAPPGYEIVREIGRGGMGVVYLARQMGLGRFVALKMILAGDHASSVELERFRSEAAALARLAHPHIVQIFEIGTHQDRPYFSLELCEGGSLHRKLAGTPLPTSAAAALVETLARAMYASHGKNVVHRDLKPSNILLTADGTPKISDFGLAKKLDEEGQTASGTVLGTPSYMAPEQAQGKTAITPLADVYSLGAILYECLTGRPPFRAATMMDTLSQVLHEEPVPPRQLNAKVPRDLETICLKCLHKESTRRYISALELADDLRRFQAGEPIHARPVGMTERAVRWVRRNPVVAGLLVTIAVTLLTGVVVSSILAVSAWREADSARTLAAAEKIATGNALVEKTRAEKAEHAVRTQLDRARRERVNAALVRATQLLTSDLAAARNVLLDGEECPWDLRDAAWHWIYLRAARPGVPLAEVPGPFPFLAVQPGGALLAMTNVGRATPLVVVDTATGRRLWTKPPEQRYLPRNLQFVNEGLAAVFEPLPAQPGPTRVLRWAAQTGNVLAEQEVPADLRGARVGGLRPVVSPDGKRLAWWQPSRLVPPVSNDGAVKVVEIATGKDVARLDLKLPPDLFAFTPDSVALVLGGPPVARTPGSCTFWLWEIAAGKERPLLKDAGTVGKQLAFDPDGQWLAGADSTGQVRIWDWKTGAEKRSIPPGSSAKVTALQWADRDSLAILRDDGSVTVARPPGNNVVGREVPPGSGPYLALLPGDRLLSLSVGRRSLLTHPLSGSPIREVAAGASPPTALAVSATGRRVAFADETPAVRVVDLDAGLVWSLPQAHQASPASALAFSPDGRTLAVGTEAGTLRLFDADTGQERAARFPALPGLRCLAYVGPDQLLLGLVPEERQPSTILLWDLTANREERRWAGTSGFFVASADRSTVAVVGAAGPEGGYGGLRVWAVADWSERLALPGKIPAVETFVLRRKRCPLLPDLSADGKVVAWINPEGTVRLWDVDDRHARSRLRWSEAVPHDLAGFALSPDGRTAMATNDSGGLILWDTATTAARVAEPTALSQGLLSRFVRFTADGTALVLGREGGGLAAVDLRAAPRTVTVDPQGRGEIRIAFSPDGRLLASVGARESRTVTLWDLTTGQRLRDLDEHTGAIHTLEFSPDNRWLAVGCAAEVVLWPLADLASERSGQAADEAPRRLACERPVRQLCFSPDGKLLAAVLRQPAPDQGPGDVCVWATANRRVSWRLALPRPQDGLAFLPDGRTLLVGQAQVGAGGRMTSTIVEYEAGTGERRAELPIWGERIAPSPSGRYLALGGSGLRLWDRQEGKAVPVGQFVGSVWPKFVDESTLLVVGFEKIQYVAIPGGKVLREVPSFGFAVGVQPGGRQVAVPDNQAGARGRIRLLDLPAP